MTIKNDRLVSKAKKLLKNGNTEEAKEIFLSILKSSPTNLEAKNGLRLINNEVNTQPTQEQLDLVMQKYSNGEIEGALKSINELIIDFPNVPLLHNICGACYSAIGQIESAINCFRKALTLKQDYSEAHFNLGVAFHQIGRLNEAISSYENAISIKHAYPTAHNNLGLIALRLGQPSRALKFFEWAVAYNPEYAEAHNSLGAALQELKQFDKSKRAFLKSVTLNPNYSQGFHNLAILSEITNLQTDDAKYYKKTLEINPNFAEAYRNQSRSKKFKKNDPQIAQMESLFLSENVSNTDKTHLSFALAKAYEDINNYEQFFEYLNEGNRLRKKELNYNIKASIKFHSDITKLFTKNSPKIQKKSLSSINVKPIFIVGMPRSGTSLVEQIISSHHLVHGAGELNNFKNIVTPFLNNYINKISKTITEDNLLEVRSGYIQSLSDLKTSKKIITDKMPVNFRLIGLILAAFPEAKIIHTLRDPVATCWSNYKHYFANENGFTFNQQDLAKFFKLYTEMMDFWHKLFPGQIYDLTYEKLTKNQKEETQALLNYCDLDWDEDCLNFHKNERAVHTASASQVRQKMYQGSSEAWKKYEAYLKPLIDGLNDN